MNRIKNIHGQHHSSGSYWPDFHCGVPGSNLGQAIWEILVDNEALGKASCEYFSFRNQFPSPHSLIIPSLMLYRMSQEKRSIFCEVIVSVIPSKKSVYVHVSYSDGFRDRAISLYSPLYTVQTSNTPCPQNALRSALMLTVEFSKMYYTR
jgi:hypothetical protein